MFESRDTKIILFVGIGVLGLLFIIAQLNPSLAPIIFIIGLFLFAGLLIILQVYYIIRLFKQDKTDRKKTMEKCPHCDAPIYKTDLKCPYCKRSIER